MKNPKILNISTLDGEWCDKDIVILHACFQILIDCIEKENLFNGHIDWTHTDEKIQVKKEIEDLYNWWKKRVIKVNIDEIDPIWTKDQYKEDNQMLIRLIDIRHHLWT